MTDLSLFDRAQMMANDPNNKLDGKPIPVLTTLLYVYCNNDEDKFDRLCGLISIIQQKTVELSCEDSG